MSKIKILVVHNFYQQAGGEDKVMMSEAELLREKGHEVILYTENNDIIKGMSFLSKIKTGIESIWSKKSYNKMISLIKMHNPDIIHFHNFFPVISPSAYYACKKYNKPVVQTLHNYRLLCPAATFLRDGEVCEKCQINNLLYSVKYGCYRNSRIQTATVAIMIYVNKMIGTWNKKVDRYIALTNFAKQKFVEGGIPENKIVIKPNFNTAVTLEYNPKEEMILYVGRISKEKGVDLLLKSWSKLEQNYNHKLVIIGDGPEKKNLEELYKQRDIIFLGKQSSEKVINYMSRAKFLAMPSIWYEGFPMTIVESFSVGTPVIASKIGSLEEIIEDNYTGLLFENKDVNQLTDVLDKAITSKNIKNFSKNVQKEFKINYTKEANYKFLEKIYYDILGGEENYG